MRAAARTQITSQSLCRQGARFTHIVRWSLCLRNAHKSTKVHASSTDRGRKAHLGLKEVATVVRIAKDSVAEVRHHTQLSSGNCVASMYLRHPPRL